jgi:hypothetical protein
MIPLAIYGLDHPKIPALLIDFRSSLNPKKREMSRRFIDDLAKNIFSLSNFGNFPLLRRPAGLQFRNRTPRNRFESADAFAQLFRTEVAAHIQLRD